jgi:demethylmenaquinone methyltransferase/2-methoxy-6-polyprenyl-1,4-benzoquinol methylase
MSADTQMLAYYSARAAEYEKVYEKPERRHDVAVLRDTIPSYFAGRDVLEVACGTGYWTRLIAREASSVTGADLSTAVLDLARSRQPAEHPATFVVADAFDLAAVPGTFDAAFVGFWWSHVLRRDLPRFLRGLHERIEPRSRIMIVDNRFVEGSNAPITRVDDDGNGYQQRRLDDGSAHEVLKNFPPAAEVIAAVEATGGRAIGVRELEFYWIATYDAP